jgi:hypothetical protein
MILNTVATKTFAGFYELLPVGTPEIVRTEDLAKAIGVGQGAINQMRAILEYTHSMTHSQYKNPREGIARTTYTLIDPPEVAARKIASLPYGSYKELKAVMDIEPFIDAPVEETVYVVEAAPVVVAPDPAHVTRTESIKSFEGLAPLRKSEPLALVEATRQYLKKWDIADTHATALVAAGLANSKEMIFASLKLDHDPVMDVVALVIPYIDELEKRIVNLDRFQDTLKAKAARVDDLEVALRRTKEQNTRLISSRTEVATNGR